MHESPFAGYERADDYASDELKPLPSLLSSRDHTCDCSHEYDLDHDDCHDTDSQVDNSGHSPSGFSKLSSLDPANAYLIQHLGPNNPELARMCRNPLESSSEDSSRRCSEMSDHWNYRSEPTHNTPTVHTLPASRSLVRRTSAGDDTNFTAQSKEAVAAHYRSLPTATLPNSSQRDPPSTKRVDSAQDVVDEGSDGDDDAPTHPSLQTAAGTDLPRSAARAEQTTGLLSDAILPSQSVSGSLPTLHPISPSGDAEYSSPYGTKLPSIRDLQATGQFGNDLTRLADVATQQDPVQPRHRTHSHSIGSSAAQSPATPYYPRSLSVQISSPTSSQNPLSARSPNSAVSDSLFGSPAYSTASGGFTSRRAVFGSERMPFVPPSLPSASSSAGSHRQSSSGTEAGFTSHSTPVDSAISEATRQRTLPAIPGLLPFQCDFPGCKAPAFHTQYLLRNVHSQNRPYYCPEPGCSRSEGGKGFKRKNEMIRHGLVHSSPGYVCPFCADREHRYPRPDNLLRHVRVSHAERDRNDPALAEVLAKRNEAPGKTRRRRGTIGGTSSGEAGGDNDVAEP